MNFQELLNIEIFSIDLYGLLFRLLLNFIFLTFIVRFIYYKKTRKKDYVFTFLLIGLVTFFLSFALKKFDIGVGMGLGLFAIFGIIRYRTHTIEIKEMTYLFVVIGLSIVNSLATQDISLAEVLIINISAVIMITGLEFYWWKDKERRQLITYENIHLILPEKHEEMKRDLEQKTGLEIIRFEIDRINFLNDTAEVKIFYKDKK